MVLDHDRLKTACSGRVGTFDEGVVRIVDRVASSLDRSQLFGRRWPVTQGRTRLLWELLGLPLPHLVDGGRIRHCGIVYRYRAALGVVSHGLSIPGSAILYASGLYASGLVSLML